MATALLELLTPAEAAEDAVSAQLRLDVRLLARRLLSATREISAHPRVRGLPVCYLGAGTGAAAALAVAASSPAPIAAVVSRGGSLDRFEHQKLRGVRAPVLLIVGGRDEEGLRANRAALPHLGAGELAVVPGATRHFEEPGALGVVARLAAGWFARHAPTRPAPGAPPPP